MKKLFKTLWVAISIFIIAFISCVSIRIMYEFLPWAMWIIAIIVVVAISYDIVNKDEYEQMAELIIVSDKRECHENCTKCTVCAARFVNKDALLEEWNKQSSRGHYEFDQTIMEFPTITESEIRAKAIDRFLTEMLNEFDSRNADIEEHT